MVKRYLKSRVMGNGGVREVEEGSPHGGNPYSLLADMYLNEFDWEFQRYGVPSDMNAHLEAVKITKNKNEKVHRPGSRQLLCGNDNL